MFLIVFIIAITTLYIIGMTVSRSIYEEKIGNKKEQEIEKQRKEIEKQQEKIEKSWEAIEEYLDKYGLPKSLKKK